MPNYQNGKIYSLRSHQTDLIYIGSTTRPLAERLAEHRKRYRYQDTGITSMEIMKFDDAYIELIENFPCNSKEELFAREGHHIRNTNCVNKFVAGRTKQEYMDANKEKFKEYQAQYRLDHKDELNEYFKHYRSAHIDEKKAYLAAYREKNKEALKQVIECECGGSYVITGKARHFNTKKHISFVDEQTKSL